MKESQIKILLTQKFAAKHVDACLKHLVAATEKYSSEDWDGVALKAGKFVEAMTKALMLYCGKPLPANMRHFKAGNELRALEQVDPKFGDAVRILIPRACIFVYEIVNNRGGRHDAGEIDANVMDARVVLPVIQWVLAELLRFCTIGGDIHAAGALIEGLTVKVHPFFEDIDGRTYVNLDGIGAPDLAVLLLYNAYPGRIAKKELVEAITRHGASSNAASIAISRLKKYIDEDGGTLKIRANGRDKAEALLRKL